MASAFVTLLAVVLVVGLAVLGLATVLVMLRAGRAEAAARDAHAYAASVGAQPASLHPKVDLDRCIGTGACATVCPEVDVLAVVSGKAVVSNPTACIGHGECLRACPVDAIALVLGSEKRGVDIPLVDKDFQTNVPGLYVVGELGGMGLVYNAMTQAMQGMAHVAKTVGPAADGVLQVLIVGAGPAGLAASLAAKKAGLSFATVDQESIGGTVLHYPRQKIVMTRPVDLPLYGKLRVTEVTKEALLEKWHDILAKTGLEVRSGVKVDAVKRGADGVFDVTTSAGPFRARAVVLAMGRRGSPRKLGVPGEDLGKVTYRLLEPERYVGSRVVVVGGGDSAIEAAVALGEAGAEATLSYRGKAFDRIKPKNQKRIDEAAAAGRVKVRFSTNVTEIRPDAVVLDGKETLANDYVLVFAGGVLPTPFLEAAGIEVKTFKGEAYAPANA